MLKTSFLLLRRAHDNNRAQVRYNAAAAVGLEVLSVLGLYMLNQVYGRLYEGIQNFDTLTIWYSITLFSFYAMLLVLVNGYLGYFINRLAFAVRAGLTTYELKDLRPRLTPNYNQRVQEDFKRFADSGTDLIFAILKSILHLPVFIGVIIGITKWYIGLGIILAVVLGTYITRRVASRLVLAQSDQENNEAEFRKTLHPEQFQAIKLQFLVLNALFKRLSFTQSGLGQAFVLLPFILLIPFYLSKTITMGAFFQSVNALGKIIDALSVLIDSRQVIVNVETCTVRLKPLVE